MLERNKTASIADQLTLMAGVPFVHSQSRVVIFSATCAAAVTLLPFMKKKESMLQLLLVLTDGAGWAEADTSCCFLQ